MLPLSPSVTVLHIRFTNAVLADAFRATPPSFLESTPRWTTRPVNFHVQHYSVHTLSQAQWPSHDALTRLPLSVGTNEEVQHVEGLDSATVLKELKAMQAAMDERHEALKKTIDEGNEKKAALVAITNKLSVFSADGVGKGLSKIGETLSKGVEAIRALAKPSTTTNVADSSGLFSGMRTSFMAGARATAHIGSRAMAKTLGGAMVAGVMAGMIAGAGYGLKTGLNTVAEHIQSVPNTAQVSATVQTAIKNILPGSTIKIGSVEISNPAANVAGGTLNEQASQRASQVVQSLQEKTPGLSKESALRTAVVMSEALVADSIVSGKSPEEAVRDQALLMALKRLQVEQTQPVVSVGSAAPTP